MSDKSFMQLCEGLQKSEIRELASRTLAEATRIRAELDAKRTAEQAQKAKAKDGQKTRQQSKQQSDKKEG